MLTQIEYFSNELFLEIFEYLNAQDIFQSFNNLNIRFNNLIYSINNLSLSISKPEPDNYQHFSSYIYSLIISPMIDVDLNHFINIRHLTLLYITDKILIQFENTNILPFLEYLFVIYKINPYVICNLHPKIFSNAFPNLISCCLYNIGIIKTTENWSQSPSIRILKLRIVNLMVYKTILSSCRNLYFLQLRISNDIVPPFYIEPHMNLKRLILKIPFSISPEIDDVINDILASTPNLEYFSLYRFISFKNFLIYFLDYNWFAIIIDIHLRLLHRFTFYIYFSSFEGSKECDMKNIRNQMEECFKKVHNNRYESRLMIPEIKRFL